MGFEGAVHLAEHFINESDAAEDLGNFDRAPAELLFPRKSQIVEPAVAQPQSKQEPGGRPTD